MKWVIRSFPLALCGLMLSTMISPTLVRGQSSSPLLSGQVLDPSGAAVPAVSVSLRGPSGTTLVVQTDAQGKYAFRNLPPGTYTLEIRVKGFTDFVKSGIVVAPGRPQMVDAHLVVAVEKQQVTVTGETTKVSVAPSQNASSLVIKGKDLESLSDDPDELQSELEALAGPAAGPNGGQIYIDGFTGGQLPPKSSIREVRINQNPFSSEYDTLGYGRIEILTKPGTDKLHGQIFASGNSSAFNSRNPFAAEIPSYHSEIFNGNIGGPLGRKTSFFVDGQRRDIQDAAVVSAVILDPSFNQVPLSQTLPTPHTRTEFSPRIDTQLGSNNTLTVRYQYWQDNQRNQGVGQFALPSQAYNTAQTDQSLQISDAQVLNEKAVTEFRFRYRRNTAHDTPLSPDPTLMVLGAFTGGGSSLGTVSAIEDYYEAQNYTSISLSKHLLKFGARARSSSEASSATTNFNGTFTFPSIQAYQITEQGLQEGLTPAQIRAAGGGASQFLIVTGNPSVPIHYLDFEPYVEDEWRPRPNITLSTGLRFETQNHIRDHADFAPRLGFAWGLGKGKSPRTVLRAGFGVFYDRFQDNYILNSERLNGINQQQYIVGSPDFYPIVPPISALTASEVPPTVYRIDPNLRAPYTVQTGIGLERQVTSNTTVSVTYLNTHGVHQFISRNINAPLPCPPSEPSCTPLNSPRPYGNTGDLYQYESSGLYNQNQVISNFNIRGSKLSLFGFYTLSFADSNTAGANTFPMNQYDLAEDYGRAAYDVRHRVFVGGSWNMPRGFQIFPFIVASSPRPFNITVGRDLNGDSIFNDRPAFATDLSRPSVVVTRWGAFDTQPIPGETIIPPNYGTGFGQFTVNLRLSKTFGFGRETGRSGGFGGGGGHGHGLGGRGLGSGGRFWNFGNTTNHRYNLTFSIAVRNLFNNVNLASPVGNLESPLFGRANALVGGFFSSNAANRRIDLQLRFTF
ncbi:MAG TPA: carboxypeptidase regulatory-like domain-containing protein [Terriglobia bacterium]|nr:carboxypeptidase regulatory-like domain-containing protein [Terriglobia bacterium]